MLQDVLSRALAVTEPRAAAALIDPVSQAMILAFAGRPRAIAEVAREREFDLKRLHHHVLRFCRLGLLEVAETRARAGRPVKLYRTVAEAFFVPHEAAPELYTERLARQLREGLARTARKPGKGFVFYVDGDGIPRTQAARGGEPLEAAEMWRMLRLSPEEMAALSAELDELLNRYLRNEKPGGRPYLLHAAVAPWIGQDAEPEPPPQRPAAWSARTKITIGSHQPTGVGRLPGQGTAPAATRPQGA